MGLYRMSDLLILLLLILSYLKEQDKAGLGGYCSNNTLLTKRILNGFAKVAVNGVIVAWSSLLLKIIIDI